MGKQQLIASCKQKHCNFVVMTGILNVDVITWVRRFKELMFLKYMLD